MKHSGINQSSHSLSHHDINEAGHVFWNLPSSRLIEIEVCSGRGRLSKSGALVVSTGKHTGRSPKDKFLVQEPETQDKIWWGKVNAPVLEETFDAIHQEMLKYIEDKSIYVLDTYAGEEEENRLPVRIITEYAWHNLFGREMFIPPTAEQQANLVPEFTVIDMPGFKADPIKYGLNSETFVLLNFKRKLIIIGGTQYAGEIKKSIFSVMNYLLPQKGVLSMHCSANVGKKGDTAIFFGLSGTGKTTLSADPERGLIGDDEHGWSDRGIFNFEGGCYAKCIHLSQEDEPQIWNAIRFGSVLENVVMDPESRLLDYDDATLTENTRAAYPLHHIENAIIPSIGDHPKNIVFLTCDAFGVLPPIARLNTSQAMYHFISGYTARVAGTERGMGNDPSATFSACFGAPFLPLLPTVYAELLARKMQEHSANVWLVNTGWSGGPYGVGNRMKIKHTRAMVNAALRGDIEQVNFSEFPVFGFQIPDSCPGVPAEVLNPRNTWRDKSAYDEKLRELAQLFIKNFEQFKGQASPEILAAEPKIDFVMQ